MQISDCLLYFRAWSEWNGSVLYSYTVTWYNAVRNVYELNRQKFSNANLCKLSDSYFSIYGVVKMWYLFFIFFLLFLYIHIFCFFLLSIAFSWFIRALPVYAWFKFTCCLPTPGQPPGQVQPFEPGGGGSCPGGRGLGQIKNYLLFDFAQYVSFLVLFTQWLRTSRLRIFKEKRRNFSESGWRGITYQN